MTAKLANAVMQLAEACLGERRHDWALAMRAEFDFAVHYGKPLAFATGCLTTALREMPRHAEGRFRLTSHAVALSLFPVVAMLIVGTTAGFPFLPTGHAGLSGWLSGGTTPEPLLTPWNQGFAPALMVLIWGIIAGHVMMPWVLLDQNWDRIATLARANAAATVTLLLFTGILFLDMAFTFLPVAGLVIELAAVWLLHRWRERLFEDAPPGLSDA